jgi:D-serine deaminase-like pyridoxal phosphate-dependent protein
MDRYRPQIGTPIQELDTPCLLVDLDYLENNFNVIREKYRETLCKMRQHSKNIKCPILAQKQIRVGGTVGGICTAKVAEAEVMVEGGIQDILIANQIATKDKMARLCALAKQAEVKIAVDNPRNLQEISEVAHAHNVIIGVVIEVDTCIHRAGIRRIEQGVELAKLAVQLPGVAFKGVMSHQLLSGGKDREARMIEGRKYIQLCLDVKEAIEAVGIPVEIVSSGETWTFDIAPVIPGVTEVQGGTYALMSTEYTFMEEFKIAAKILGTIISTPRLGVAIGDVGYKSLASPGGRLPTLEGIHGVWVDSLQEDHIILRSEGHMPLNIGNQFLLLNGHQDSLVNRWDQFIVVRNGLVEAVWDIPGRGCHH